VGERKQTMGRIGVLTVAYREETFIKNCISQFKGRGYRHLVLICDSPWHGQREEIDKTPDICDEMGVEYVVSDWNTEAEMRNYGVSQLKDCDWILIVDADERYEQSSLDKLESFLGTAELSAYGIQTLYTYWKATNLVVDPKETGGLIVAVRPRVVFTDKRCIDSKWGFLHHEIVLHHFSYVRTDEQMKRKLETFEHYDEIVPNWYEEVWLKWTPDMINLHPTNPPSFHAVIRKELPGNVYV